MKKSFSTSLFPMHNKTTKRGFTMIELLVASTIMIVLSALVLVSYSSTLKRSRDARRRADIEQVRAALEVYRTANPTIGYPANTSGTSSRAAGASNFASLITLLSSAPAYLSNNSVMDPKVALMGTVTDGYAYLYYASTSAPPRRSYEVCAQFETIPTDCRGPGIGAPGITPSQVCCFIQP